MKIANVPESGLKKKRSRNREGIQDAANRQTSYEAT